MFNATRTFLALGFAVALIAGCDKKSTTPTATSTPSGAPGKPQDDGYSKKLVGVWEGKEKFGEKEESMTVEFKADGSMKMSMGPFEGKGTYKVVKEDGKTLTIDTEMSMEGLGDPKAPPKTDKKTLTAAFEDANTVVLQKVGEKPDPLKLKRKM